MKKTVSLTSTILMTIYTVLVTISNLGAFALAAFFTVVGDIDSGSVATGTSTIASVVMLVIAFVLLILTITLIVATVLSYKFIRSRKFMNDAWMKIIIFGILLLGFLFMISSAGLMAFCELMVFCAAVLLALPIGLSVVVLCGDSKNEKESTKEPEKNS